jgi:hypothetical protein
MAPGIIAQPLSATAYPTVQMRRVPVKVAPSATVHETAQSTYTIKEEPLGTRRPFRTVCLGGGYAGLMMAIAVGKKLIDPAHEFVIYEKNHDMGGTWLENRCVLMGSVFGSRPNTSQVSRMPV